MADAKDFLLEIGTEEMPSAPLMKAQDQLGKLVGVTDKAVSKWENGEAYPRLGHCLRLAEKLGVSLDELLKLWNAPDREDARRAG